MITTTTIKRLAVIGFVVAIIANVGSGGGTSEPKTPNLKHNDRLIITANEADTNVLACEQKSDIEKFLQLIASKDSVALGAFTSMKLRLGGCKGFTQGTEVIVEDIGVWSDNLCVRRLGEYNCYWTNKVWVKPK